VRILKIVVIVAFVYVGIVVAFESLIGILQPASESTLVIRTFDEDCPHDRVVSRLESGGQLYVAANHWPRDWYERALENPELEVVGDGETGSYLAVAVTGAEHEQVSEDNGLPVFFRVLTGFPPRYFLRLDPR